MWRRFCQRLVLFVMFNITYLQSRPKLVETLGLYHVSPIPPNQCWKISRFFQQKGKKSPDYQHWKWGGGENLLRVPTLLSGIVARWAGKMNQIARCDWLPEQARWSYLARSGLPAVSRKKNSPQKPYNKFFKAYSVKMAGYWPGSSFASYGSRLRLRPLTRKKKRIWLKTSLIIWLCLTRTGNYQIHEFDWLKRILTAV